MSRGIIYLAIGAKYLAEGVASARSSLRFNRISHVIFCDQAPAESVAGIEFRKIVSSGDAFLDKINVINSSPYTETLYLDTDTYVVDDIHELFDLLQRFDLAMAHAHGYLHSDDPVPSEAFNDFNTGVIVYRNSDQTKTVLTNWRDIYMARKHGPLGPYNTHDQPAMRSAIWNGTASVYVLSPEYNCRAIYYVRLVGKAKILHLRSQNYEWLAATLNSKTGIRGFVPDTKY